MDWQPTPINSVRPTFFRSGACGLSVPAARREASREPRRVSAGPATAARRLLRRVGRPLILSDVLAQMALAGEWRSYSNRHYSSGLVRSGSRQTAHNVNALSLGD